MSTIPIEDPSEWFCVEERAVVENRGANFGKIYLLDENGHHRGHHMLWTATAVSHSAVELDDEMVGRAVRALKASPWCPKFLEAS